MLARLFTIGLLCLPAGPALAQSSAQHAATSLASLFQAGEAAIFTCSATFLAGRSLEAIRALELTDADNQPSLVAGNLPEITVDREAGVVSAPFASGLPPMRAAYREGLGCSVLPFGASVDLRHRLPRLSEPRPTYAKDDASWGRGSPISSSSLRSPFADSLDRVIEAAFDGKTYGQGTRTVGIVVVHQGNVVAERYREGFGPHVQYRTWSTAKSFTNTMVGAALHNKIMPPPSAPAPIPEWQGADDPRRAITLANLLNMASGLRTLNPQSGSSTPLAYWGGGDVYADAASLPPDVAPGSKFHYSNYDTLLLARALKASIGDDQAFLDFPYERIFDKIGMHDTFMETDFYGNYVSSSQIYTTARDLIRLGYLYLKDGVYKGERILADGWVRYTCTPSTVNQNYGAQWWLHHGKVKTREGERELTFCHTNGGRGQHMTFVPEYDLIIARTGVDSRSEGSVTFNRGRFFEDVTSVFSSGER